MTASWPGLFVRTHIIRKFFLGLEHCLLHVSFTTQGVRTHPNGFPQKQRGGPSKLWFLRRRRRKKGEVAVLDVEVRDSPQNLYLALTAPWAGQPGRAWAKQGSESHPRLWILFHVEGTWGRMMSVLWRQDCLGCRGCVRLRGSREPEKPGLRWRVEPG